jgi:hypothetical protein
MFCPNCGFESQADQLFCRTCGLKLGEITQLVAEQRPTEDYAELQRRKLRFEKLGVFSLSLFGFLFFAILMGWAAYYKIILFGANVIFGAACVAMVLFGLMSVFFFNYPKVFMKMDKVNPRLDPSDPEPAIEPATTAKLIEERPFEPIPSVTEETTHRLKVKG